MLIPALILSVVFVTMAFVVTKSNARYILSGYNTMSDAERALVDIDGYLKFYKQFHLFLGLSVWVGVMLFQWTNKNLSGIFLGVYPLLAYIYFIAKSRKYYFSTQSQKAGTVLVLIILVGAAVGTGYLFWNGLRNGKVLLNKDDLEITGMYGGKIDRKDILSATLVPGLPDITIRSDGFSAGDFRKGYFRTKDKKTVKLIVNSRQVPLLMLTTPNGLIYFSSTDQPSERLVGSINRWKGF